MSHELSCITHDLFYAIVSYFDGKNSGLSSEKGIVASLDSKQYKVSSKQSEHLKESAASSLVSTADCLVPTTCSLLPPAYSGRTSQLKPGAVLIEIDSRYFRPTEVEFLLGDAARAKKKLGWEPKVKFEELVRMMVDADIRNLG